MTGVLLLRLFKTSTYQVGPIVKMDSRQVIPADYKALEFVPNFFTTAVPTSLTSELLDNLGYRRKSVIRIRVTCLNYPNCRAFQKEFIQIWWSILGQEVNNIEECNAKHYEGSRGDLKLTYHLKAPIHLDQISETERFEIFSAAQSQDCRGPFSMMRFRCMLIDRESPFDSNF